MPRKKSNQFFHRGQITELTIDTYAFGGKGIAKINNEKGNYIVFVPNTIPGQKVKVQIDKLSKNYAEAKLIDILEKSDLETENQFQEIAGAPYINLPLEIQHEYKKNSTLELFKRIGKIASIDALFDELISSPTTFHYRNKMEYGFSAIGYDFEKKTDVDAFTLGFKRRGVWWMAENLDKDAGLFDKQVEDELKNIRNYCEKTGLTAWHYPKREGFFRYLVVRKSVFENSLLFNLVTTSDELHQFDLVKFGTFLHSIFKERFAGFLHTINDESGDRTIATAGSIKLILGKEKIVEQLLGLQFEISMQSFFQTNPKSAEKLYQKVIDYVLENNPNINNSVVLDLFCGTGTIGQLIASKTKNTQVIGVDIVKTAIDDAKQNAARNNIKNVQFFAEDVGKFLQHHPEYQNQIKTLVLDPARGGIIPKTLQKIIDLGAERIVYVSCNPATQARDHIELANAGYQLQKISLVDQFPHTSHIETVALYLKK